MHHPDTFVPSSVGVLHVQCWVWGPREAGSAAAHACTEMKLGGIEVVVTAVVAQVRCVGEGEKGRECRTGRARTGGLASSAVGCAVRVFAPAGRSGALRVDCCSMCWCRGIATGMLHIGTWGGTAFCQGREGWAWSNDTQGCTI